MKTLYSFLVVLCQELLPLLGGVSSKMKRFVTGRKAVFSTLKTAFNEGDKVLWFHAASLGEYEQGLPVMQNLKKRYPDYKLLLTFFSPSGYEIKKNNPIANCTVYLPLDTPKNARRFVEMVKPEWAIFIKYEIWPNYMTALKKNNVKTLLFSGLFRSEQIFFKSYGKFMRKALFSFDKIFVQNQTSEDLLKSIGVKNVSISGDTRFDRVSHQIEQNNKLSFVEVFLQDKLCIVGGSTWPEDEALLTEYINTANNLGCKFIIAPHEIKSQRIEDLKNKLKKTTVLYSERTQEKLKEADVLIVDTIGLLSKIYRYADVAYVGGAMGNTGLHNILEPATFGVPILVGKNYGKFPEAVKLNRLAGLFAVEGQGDFQEIAHKLINDNTFRKTTGMICGHFVQSNTGATQKIMQYFQVYM